MVRFVRLRLGAFLGYSAAALSTLLAVGLWFSGSPAFAVGIFLVGCTSYYGTRRLMVDVDRANAQKFLLDQQLIQSQKLAAIGELSAGIAHEINNPLAIIGQEVEWMRHILQNTRHAEDQLEDMRDSCREITRQVERCRDITHRLLDFARKKEPLMQAVNINRLVEDMARLVEKEAVHKRIRILRDYSENIASVHTDPPMVRQVVLNLLINAMYAIGEDGCIAITTRTSENGAAEVVVRDTGCGIAQEDQGRIFDPFFTTKPQGKGTGLGLSICHGIVSKLGGSISVESEPGKGAVFTIRLPIRRFAGEG